ncbi:GNAT family N-acetyltransferase [Cereibacter changlensis JA139]|uniref:GNAT family N-acetyltransferase n=2 Tax=Cereibacter changlensis TaxID=402884 RepID=A0A2T4JR87_9RHOB|nr:GNAT family N-acetyltransferase [Cereibacter changlensis]PTE20419.1 GNAT family N-acetyltransferase [Cereibacter changlensis JA139]PZX58734.1 acetyltransferase (GNAT) family protein [Cereibacter changlensis]
MTPAELYATLDATWPAATTHRAGPWLVRDGQGGGKRVSAVTVAAPWAADDIPRAEAAQAALGQPALFMLRAGDAALDAELERRGYAVVDPVTGYAMDLGGLEPAPPMSAFAHWPPLGIAEDLWAEGGIGPARLAVMHRVAGPKTAILGRQNDRASGVAFIAIHGETAMLHGLEVTPSQRRQGSANNILRCAAAWAQDQGTKRFSLVVTTGNDPARRLYASFGMRSVGQYHYRMK